MNRAALLTMALCAVTAEHAAAQARLVVDADSVLSLEIPAGWKDMDLDNEEASIQVADEAEEAFFLVITEDKGDMFGWNLTRYQYITLAQMMVMLDFPEVAESEYVQLDGSDAVRYVVRGATGGFQLSYLRVTIDGPTSFVQLVGWSARSGWERHRPTLEAIISSAKLLR